MATGSVRSAEVLGAVEGLLARLAESKGILMLLLKARGRDPDLTEMAQLALSALDLLTDLNRSFCLRSLRLHEDGALPIHDHERRVLQTALLACNQIDHFLTRASCEAEPSGSVH